MRRARYHRAVSGAHGRSPSPARSRLRWAARLIGWNVLILFAGFVLLAGGAELYLRLTTPFLANVRPVRLAPGVGLTRPPHAEVRYTNWSDFWQVSRANSLGFLDREPPGAERAAESCHVTLIGDSFVEGREVPLADRAQVRLEELAARELPALDITTSGFGFSATGQINQLAFYDAWARRLSPDVVVLVFVQNDFQDNSLALSSWYRGIHPDHPPWVYAVRGADGEMEFVPPASSLDELRANLLPRPPEGFGRRVERKLREWSYFADWMWTQQRGIRGTEWWVRWEAWLEQRQAWAELIRQHPRHETFTQGWPRRNPPNSMFLKDDPPPDFREALDVTVFALEQFRERAERDGAALVILADRKFGAEGSRWFELLRGLVVEAGGDGIPVISQYDYVAAMGDDPEDLDWAHDDHWNATGHVRAAEAILEWLKQNPGVCG